MKKQSKPCNILITAGPTREFLDPVRFISNPSTGTIGYLIAAAAAKKKHNVVLVSGPTHCAPPKRAALVRIVSARDLFREVKKYFSWADCVIGTAAVSDYRPRRYCRQKIKKSSSEICLNLVKNPDVLKNFGLRKKNKVVVGFALETKSVVSNARKKLKEKNLDFIVANKLSRAEDPFGGGRHNVFIIDQRKVKPYEGVTKEVLARIILDRAIDLCYSLQKKEGRRDEKKNRIYAS